MTYANLPAKVAGSPTTSESYFADNDSNEIRKAIVTGENDIKTNNIDLLGTSITFNGNTYGFRYDAVNGMQYSNDGTTWVNFNDAGVSDISITCGENIDSNKAVYINTTDSKVYKASDNNIIGFTTESKLSGESVNIRLIGKLSGFTGLSAGEWYKVDSSTPGDLIISNINNAVAIALNSSTVKINIIKNIVFPYINNAVNMIRQLYDRDIVFNYKKEWCEAYSSEYGRNATIIYTGTLDPYYDDGSYYPEFVKEIMTGTLHDPDTFANTANAFDLNSSTYSDKTIAINSTTIDHEFGKTFTAREISFVYVDAGIYNDTGRSGTRGIYLDYYDGTDWIEHSILRYEDSASSYTNFRIQTTVNLNKVVQGLRVRTIAILDTSSTNLGTRVFDFSIAIGDESIIEHFIPIDSFNEMGSFIGVPLINRADDNSLINYKLISYTDVIDVYFGGTLQNPDSFTNVSNFNKSFLTYASKTISASSSASLGYTFASMYVDSIYFKFATGTGAQSFDVETYNGTIWTSVYNSTDTGQRSIYLSINDTIQGIRFKCENLQVSDNLLFYVYGISLIKGSSTETDWLNMSNVYSIAPISDVNLVKVKLKRGSADTDLTPAIRGFCIYDLT